MKYKEIRKNYQNHNYIKGVFVNPYVLLISPVFTMFFLKKKVIPNKVTVLMINIGIVSAILFAVPCLPIKIIGAIFIHIWYVLDCSDGEVARITKNFSMFGKELDYLAHLVNHTLFTLSFAVVTIQTFDYHPQKVILCFGIIICTDLIIRNMATFSILYGLKKEECSEASNNTNKTKTAIMYLVNFFIQFPNFALIYPVVYFIDKKLESNILIWYLLCISIVSVLYVGMQVIRWKEIFCER